MMAACQYLCFPNYSIEINSGQQFLFSITYADVTDSGQNTKVETSVHRQMSKDDKNVQGKMSKSFRKREMSINMI